MEDYTQEGMPHALGWPKAIKKQSWRSGKVCKWGEAATAQDYLYSSLSYRPKRFRVVFSWFIGSAQVRLFPSCVFI